MNEGRDSLAGKLLAGKYRLLRELSRGGMGQIYLAEHIDLQEPRAIKVIREELVADEATRRRFLREIRATHRVSKHNEHVVLIYDDYGFEDGIGYYVMEFLDGRPLSKFIQRSRGTLSVEWSLQVVIEICLAMDEIHRADVIHRDLKPDNIMLIERPGKPDLVKVFDFGIAKFKDIETRSTSMTQLVGTISYMSPEQISVPLEHVNSDNVTSDIDHRSDIYSLGCILFEMLAGKTPFAPDPRDSSVAPHQLLWSHLHDPAPSILLYRPDVPNSLDAVLLRSLQKNPDDRFQTMQQFADALTLVLSALPKEDDGGRGEPTSRELGAVKTSIPKREKDTDPHAVDVMLGSTESTPRILVAQSPDRSLVLHHETQTLQSGELRLSPPAYDPSQPTLMLHLWPMRTKAESSPWEARTITDADLSEHDRKNTFSSAPATVESPMRFPLAEVPIYPSPPSTPPPLSFSANAPNTSPTPVFSDPKRTRWFVWIVLLFLLLGAGSAYWLAKNQDWLFNMNLLGVSTSRDLQTDGSGTSGKCPPSMVFFSAGKFLFGSATNDDLRSFYEAALRVETTGDYCIDTHEYPGAGKMPLVLVTYQEAQTHCRRQKKRLCTELEWERACKGESIYRYPYGNHFASTFCNTRDAANKNRPVAATGSFPQCRNSFGLYDMSGNVAEWTDSAYRFRSTRKVIRGGAANRPDWAVRCASRSSAEPSEHKDMIGFRCCSEPLKP